MKLPPRDAAAYFSKPESSRPGILIYGADAMRVALRRQELIKALIGPGGNEEMRLARMTAADLRKDPARLLDTIKAQGFFPGPRVVLLEEANDNVVSSLTDALQDWQPGDANLVVTAGTLRPASKLRKLFEGHGAAYAAAIYEDPPSRGDIEADLRKAGVQNVGADAMHAITALARALDPGDFRQTVEKIALYKLGDDTPVTAEDIEVCAPTSIEAELDDILHVVTEARPGEVAQVMRRLRAQGVQPVTLCMAASRHFRMLYAAASDPGGVSRGMAALRPPIFGPRRDRMQRQAQNWGAARLEKALMMITDTDLRLRAAAQTAPDMALLERTLIRLALRKIG